jgi:peptidoglycan hydrolase CwlO-like protein
MDDLTQRLDALEKLVAEHAEAIQENRRLNRRVAELTDVVMELVTELAKTQDPAVMDRIRAYTNSLS